MTGDRISADELECRVHELDAAERRYWTADADPHASRADAELAARLLGYAEHKTREAVAAPAQAEAEAGPQAEAGL